MTHEEIKKLEENTEKYKKALTLVYADGDVSSVERNRLISLKKELGLPDSVCMAMESHFHETANLDEIKVNEIKKIYHCHLCDNDGGIKWHGIDHSMLEYIEVGDTYIETSNGGSYTGLREPFVLSIGQSFEDLLDEYGEKHIYDAIEDGKLQVFDEQNDLETYLKLRFDILDFEDMERVYLKQLDNQNLADYIKTLERNGYDVSSLTEDMDFNHVTKIDLLQEYLNSDEKHNFEVLNTPFNPEKNMALVVWDNENHKLSEWNVDVLHQYLAERLLEDKGIVPVLRDEIIPDLIKSLEEGSRKKLIDNRIDLLNGKTELSQDELYQLVEFKQEYTSNDTLEVFTNLKKIKGIVSDSQVLENPMLEHGSSPKNNIQQPSPVVNSKMSDWEMKYSSLSAEKLISFISDEAFTKEMAAFTLADFEGNGTPLVIDELGNVCEKNIWESKEENAIVDYMPSGILTKEIEIIEDFLTGHTDIPAKQRVEVLKLKDSLEEINDRLIIKEEKSEEQERRSSRSDKEIVKDYLDRIKDNLPPSDRNIVDEVMKASSKALADFTAEEKKVIGKYLMENGAKDQKSLGNLLKKKVEPEHNHETNRDIERGR